MNALTRTVTSARLSLTLPACCLALLLMLPFSLVTAHTNSTGSATIDARGQNLSYRLTVVPTELGESAADVPKAASGDPVSAARVSAWLHSLIRLEVDGSQCHVAKTRIQSSAPGAERVALSLDYVCAKAPGRLQLSDRLAVQFGEHYRTIVSVSRADGQREERVLDMLHSQAVFELGQPPVSSLVEFVRLGFTHMLNGLDHLLFLAALLAGSRSLRSLLIVITMFTLAHSVSLAVSVLDIAHISATIVEPLIAASIVWVAVENVWLTPVAMRRYALAFVFGLIHGLAFAEGLVELKLAGWSLLRALFGFNLGVELAQGLVVLLVAPLLAWLSQRGIGQQWLRLASLAIGALGVFWFIQRAI